MCLFGRILPLHKSSSKAFLIVISKKRHFDPSEALSYAQGLSREGAVHSTHIRLPFAPFHLEVNIPIHIHILIMGLNKNQSCPLSSSLPNLAI